MREKKVYMKQTLLRLCQENDYRVYLKNPLSKSYNIYCALELKGELNRHLLNSALNTIIAQNDVLRMSFELQQDKVAAIYHNNVSSTIEIILPKNNNKKINSELESIIKHYSSISFDLSNPPLFRSYLIQLSRKTYIFFVVFHHIIVDGWSINLFIKKLAIQYNTFTKGEFGLPSNNMHQYSDYINHQKTQLTRNVISETMKFWKKQFTPLPPPLEMPTDYPRIKKEAKIKKYTVPISVDLLVQMREFSKEKQVTIFCIFLSSIQILLSLISKQKDIVIGVPFNARNKIKWWDVLGFFINDVPLIARLSETKSFSDLVNSNQKLITKVYKYQNFLVSDLISELKIPLLGDGSQNIFQVMLNYVDFLELPMPRNFGGLSSQLIYVNSGEPHYDLFFDIQNYNNESKITIKYNSNLFKLSTIETIMQKLNEILKKVVYYPHNCIFSYEL